MGPTVTRNTIWLNAGQYPYIDLEIKGVSTFTTFAKTLEFYTPTHKTAIWLDMTPKQAKEDYGMDLLVRPWSWWLVIDGISEISCSYSGTYGQAVVNWYDGYTGSQKNIRVTDTEAADICKAVKSMVANSEKGAFKKGPKGILQPGGMMIKYRVQSLVYHRSGSALPKHAITIPSFVAK